MGGDFYDCIPFNNEQIRIVIGNVSGKGLSAALYMARLMSDFWFDAQMNPVDEWRHFGRPSGVAILSDDSLFVADSESNKTIAGKQRNPGWTNGVRFGSATDGSLIGFIDGTDPEGLAVDELGTVWAGLTSTPILQKWVKE